ncbi:MAG: hypothetical protein WBE72_22115 [Terracidiphilus sp.]
MKSKAQNAERRSKTWPTVMSWVGRATALIGLCASLAGGVTWLVRHHAQEAQRKAKMALAQAQAEQGDYAGAVASYAEILKTDPSYRPAVDGQLSATEQWVENFHVAVPDGESAAGPAAAMLDEIMPILDAGLTRSTGAQAAEVQAHIGWARWLNESMAEREFGTAPEQDFRAAVTLDPGNVYANAMLGNWMLQNNGDFDEAMRHLDVAVATGKERPWVRKLELGGLRYLDKKGARAAQVKVANDMRKGGEPLDESYRIRILSFCFDPQVTDHDELVESLSAVPADEEWKTYLWLDDNPSEEYREEVHEFIHADLLEVSGDKTESLEQFRSLQQKLKDSPGTMKDQVDAEVARLSHK